MLSNVDAQMTVHRELWTVSSDPVYTSISVEILVEVRGEEPMSKAMVAFHFGGTISEYSKLDVTEKSLRTRDRRVRGCNDGLSIQCSIKSSNETEPSQSDCEGRS